MRIMAIDYGDARTGLAVSDLLGFMCGEAWTVEDWDPRRLAGRIAQAAREREVGTLVLGLPKNMDGSEGARAARTRRFAQRLADACGLPVALWDERRTTVTAAAILAGNDTFGQKRKQRLDSVSAAVLLDGFLAWRRNHPDAALPETVAPHIQKEE